MTLIVSAVLPWRFNIESVLHTRLVSTNYQTIEDQLHRLTHLRQALSVRVPKQEGPLVDVLQPRVVDHLQAPQVLQAYERFLRHHLTTGKILFHR